MLIARIVLSVTSAMFGVLGLVFLAWPEATAAKLGIEAASPAGVTEMRATYGGLELGLAALFLVCALRTSAVGVGLWAMIAVFGGFAAGRIAGMVWAGGADAVHVKILLVELLGFAGGCVLLKLGAGSR